MNLYVLYVIICRYILFMLLVNNIEYNIILYKCYKAGNVFERYVIRVTIVIKLMSIIVPSEKPNRLLMS